MLENGQQAHFCVECDEKRWGGEGGSKIPNRNYWDGDSVGTMHTSTAGVLGARGKMDISTAGVEG